ncbi:MAG: hypothetical protein IKP45_06950 [Bacteroidales bacterium]|nr:hypothetical protein [Bacteroidales bacterium]
MKNFVILLVAFAFVFCSCSKDNNSGVQKITSLNDCEYCEYCRWKNGRVEFEEHYSSLCIKPKMSGVLSFKCYRGAVNIRVEENDTIIYKSSMYKNDIASCKVQKNENVTISIGSYLIDSFNDDFTKLTKLTLSNIKIVGNGSSGVEQDDSDNGNYSDF